LLDLDLAVRVAHDGGRVLQGEKLHLLHPLDLRTETGGAAFAVER
jgi:hypothetical protein